MERMEVDESTADRPDAALDATYTVNARAKYEARKLENRVRRDVNEPPAFVDLESPMKKGFLWGWDEAEKVLVRNPWTMLTSEVDNILLEDKRENPDETQLPLDRKLLPDRAYLLGRHMKDGNHGYVRECTVIKLSEREDLPFWDFTKEKAAVKVLVKAKMRSRRVDPKKEVAALKYVAERGNHHNVVSPLHALPSAQHHHHTVLEHKDFVFICMPFHSAGCLHDMVLGSPDGRLEEDIARFWFRQILKGLAHLHRNGICHGDMTLENVVIDPVQRKAKIIDFDLSLLVPYGRDENGRVNNVKQAAPGSLRHLITTSGPFACGRRRSIYVAPEIFGKEDRFDGLAVDLWGTAVMLFVMLVGKDPWDFPFRTERGYRMIALATKGNIEARAPEEMELEETGVGRLVLSVKRKISPAAANLLQRMLFRNPEDRLSLDEVLQHTWVTTNTDDELATPEFKRRVDAWIRKYGVPDDEWR